MYFNKNRQLKLTKVRYSKTVFTYINKAENYLELENFFIWRIVILKKLK